jgi:hypothetical protein
MSQQDISQNGTDEKLWDKKQTAGHARFSLRKLDYLIQAGLIPYVKIGKHVRFIPRDVREFVRSHRIG